MGPLFVLIFWTIVASVLSVLGGTVLTALVRLLTRRVVLGRTRATCIAAIFPAACFAYLFCCVMVFSIWSSMRGRDWGWGDTWDTPIADDYHLMMIDVTDKGTLYSRSDTAAYDGHGGVFGTPTDRKVIFGVRRLEVREPFLFGAANPQAFMEDSSKSPESLFFLLNMRSGERTDFPSEQILKQESAKMGKPLHLQPVDVVYRTLRYTKADFLLLIAFLTVPTLTALFLVRALVRIRRHRSVSYVR